jgi:hypothetical protein
MPFPCSSTSRSLRASLRAIDPFQFLQLRISGKPFSRNQAPQQYAYGDMEQNCHDRMGRGEGTDTLLSSVSSFKPCV